MKKPAHKAPQDIVAIGGGYKILCALNHQNELLERLCRLVGKLVNSEAEMERRPRRSVEQTRQLSLALEVLKKDPLHNVRSAARYAFKKAKGYKSLESLQQALHKRWNCRVR